MVGLKVFCYKVCQFLFGASALTLYESGSTAQSYRKQLVNRFSRLALVTLKLIYSE